MFINAIADKVLGPKDEVTGQRPGDPTGIASAMAGVGDGMMAVAAAAAVAPEVLNQIRSGMEGLVSGGREASSVSANTTPAVARASTPDLPAMG